MRLLLFTIMLLEARYLSKRGWRRTDINGVEQTWRDPENKQVILQSDAMNIQRWRDRGIMNTISFRQAQQTPHD